MKNSKKVEIKIEFAKGNSVQLGKVSESLDEEDNLNGRHTSLTPELNTKI